MRSLVHHVVLSGLLLALPFAAYAGPRPKLDRALLQAITSGAGSPQRVIVSGGDLCLTAVRSVLHAHGGTVNASLPGALAVTPDADGVAALGAPASYASGVATDAVVTADGTGVSRGEPTIFSVRQLLGLGSTSPKGTGIGVAVIDSGIAPVRDFGHRITAFYDFTRAGIAAPPSDEYGHGTHIAGLIAGDGSSGSFYRGMAPGARLIGLKVLDATGQGRTSDVIRAIDFARVNRHALGIDVINLSLGHPIYESGDSLPGMRLDATNVVWGNDNVVWGDLTDDNIAWGNLSGTNVVWGNSVEDITSGGLVADWRESIGRELRRSQFRARERR